MKYEFLIYLFYIIELSVSYSTDLLLLEDRIAFLEDRNRNLYQNRKKLLSK